LGALAIVLVGAASIVLLVVLPAILVLELGIFRAFRAITQQLFKRLKGH
jgi:hypothetical protein